MPNTHICAPYQHESRRVVLIYSLPSAYCQHKDTVSRGFTCSVFLPPEMDDSSSKNPITRWRSILHAGPILNISRLQACCSTSIREYKHISHRPTLVITKFVSRYVQSQIDDMAVIASLYFRLRSLNLNRSFTLPWTMDMKMVDIHSPSISWRFWTPICYLVFSAVHITLGWNLKHSCSGAAVRYILQAFSGLSLEKLSNKQF
jgi:hypothetical protein